MSFNATSALANQPRPHVFTPATTPNVAPQTPAGKGSSEDIREMSRNITMARPDASGNVSRGVEKSITDFIHLASLPGPDGEKACKQLLNAFQNPGTDPQVRTFILNASHKMCQSVVNNDPPGASDKYVLPGAVATLGYHAPDQPQGVNGGSDKQRIEAHVNVMRGEAPATPCLAIDSPVSGMALCTMGAKLEFLEVAPTMLEAGKLGTDRLTEFFGDINADTDLNRPSAQWVDCGASGASHPTAVVAQRQGDGSVTWHVIDTDASRGDATARSNLAAALSAQKNEGGKPTEVVWHGASLPGPAGLTAHHVLTSIDDMQPGHNLDAGDLIEAHLKAQQQLPPGTYEATLLVLRAEHVTALMNLPQEKVEHQAHAPSQVPFSPVPFSQFASSHPSLAHFEPAALPLPAVASQAAAGGAAINTRLQENLGIMDLSVKPDGKIRLGFEQRRAFRQSAAKLTQALEGKATSPLLDRSRAPRTLPGLRLPPSVAPHFKALTALTGPPGTCQDSLERMLLDQEALLQKCHERAQAGDQAGLKAALEEITALGATHQKAVANAINTLKPFAEPKNVYSLVTLGGDFTSEQVKSVSADAAELVSALEKFQAKLTEDSAYANLAAFAGQAAKQEDAGLSLLGPSAPHAKPAKKHAWSSQPSQALKNSFNVLQFRLTENTETGKMQASSVSADTVTVYNETHRLRDKGLTAAQRTKSQEALASAEAAIIKVPGASRFQETMTRVADGFNAPSDSALYRRLPPGDKMIALQIQLTRFGGRQAGGQVSAKVSEILKAIHGLSVDVDQGLSVEQATTKLKQLLAELATFLDGRIAAADDLVKEASIVQEQAGALRRGAEAIGGGPVEDAKKFSALAVQYRDELANGEYVQQLRQFANFAAASPEATLALFSTVT